MIGNDISGFADPAYLVTAAAAGAAVVATHIRLRPRLPDPDPHYGDVVADVASFLAERADRARAVGIPDTRIILDAGLDLGKTPTQSATLLRCSDDLASLGWPLLLSASNKPFLGVLFGLASRRAGRRHHGGPRPRGEPRLPDPSGPRRPGGPASGRHPECRHGGVEVTRGLEGSGERRHRNRARAHPPVILVDGDDATLIAEEVSKGG